MLNENEQVEGLITLRRIRALSQQARLRTTLREAACPIEQVPTAAPEETPAAILPRLANTTDGRILVFDADRLVDIISPSDISSTIINHGLRIPIPGATTPKPTNQPTLELVVPRANSIVISAALEICPQKLTAAVIAGI
ncbi:CBS domain-containing protein [Saccharopolyspora pogona]|uniref:CBS domain-containing protein n=1 Tax=Saccharopolyspora pogona TaxID=333966 RepID=UPI001682371D|nr:CBS domain-containing protein [Saccharopolyspora pogona]